MVSWICKECGYQLSADEFEDDYVFWFCDNCDAYLNNQENFDRGADRHICRNCGYENDTTLDNVKGICSDCGKVIADQEATLCPECKQRREQKAKEWLVAKAGKVVGVVTAVAGAAAYLASQISSDDSTEDDTDGVSLKKDWLRSASEDELRAKKKKSLTARIGVLGPF